MEKEALKNFSLLGGRAVFRKKGNSSKNCQCSNRAIVFPPPKTSIMGIILNPYDFWGLA
jgi:hypothetical protein